MSFNKFPPKPKYDPDTGPVYLYVNRRRHPFTREVAEKIVDVVLAGVHATTP